MEDRGKKNQNIPDNAPSPSPFKESYSLQQFDVRAGKETPDVWRLFPRDVQQRECAWNQPPPLGCYRGKIPALCCLNPPCESAPLVPSFQTNTAFVMSDCNSLGLSLYLTKRTKKSKGLLSFVFPLATEFPPWHPGILAALITMEIACP